MLSGNTTVGIECCIFEQNGPQQTILKIELSISDYLAAIKAPFLLNPAVSDAVSSYFDLYVQLNAISSATSIIYSSLDHTNFETAIKGYYPGEYGSIIPIADVQQGLNFDIDCSLDSKAASYFKDLFSGTNGSISTYGVVKVQTSALEEFLYEEQEADDKSSGTSKPQPQPFLFVSQGFSNSNSALTLLNVNHEVTLTLNSIAFGFALNDTNAVAPEVVLKGKVGMNSKKHTVEIDYFLYQRMMSLNFVDFPDLTTMIDSFSDSTERFPAPLNILTDMNISDLEIVFDVEQKTVAGISLSAASTNSITLIENAVEVTTIFKSSSIQPRQC